MFLEMKTSPSVSPRFTTAIIQTALNAGSLLIIMKKLCFDLKWFEEYVL